MEKNNAFRAALNELMGSSPENEEGFAPAFDTAYESASGAQPGMGASGATEFEVYDITDNLPTEIPQPNTTIVKEGISIEGSMACDHDMLFSGIIRGNLKCDGKLTVHGQIHGNVSASQVELCGARIRGDVLCSGGMLVDSETILVGDVETASLHLDGKVKGDMIVNGKASLLGNAYVLGDLCVNELVMAQGASLNGKLSMRNTERNSNMFNIFD